MAAGKVAKSQAIEASRSFGAKYAYISPETLMRSRRWKMISNFLLDSIRTVDLLVLFQFAPEQLRGAVSMILGHFNL